MATKRQAPRATHKNDDSVVYKVMAALLAACLECLAVQQVSKYYVTIEHMESVRSGLFVAGFVLAALAAACAIIAVLVRRKPSARFGFVLAAANLAACCGASFVLYAFWTGPAILLYFAFFALAALISVRLLYQPEFFLLSTATVAAAFGFYCLSQLSRSSSPVLWATLNALLAALFVLLGLIALLANRGKGILSFGRRRIPVYITGTPLPLYITSALWLLCLVCGMFLGSSFSYCCIFAAIAYEFIFAFYFTVKLK